MHSDIAKAIDLIDQRIQTLQNIRTQLIQEFGDIRPATIVQPEAAEVHTLMQRLRDKRQGPNSPTRKDQVADFIRKNGPAYRSQIAQGVAVPAGTISYCLNDKARFQQLRDGKWTLVE